MLEYDGYLYHRQKQGTNRDNWRCREFSPYPATLSTDNAGSDPRPNGKNHTHPRSAATVEIQVVGYTCVQLRQNGGQIDHPFNTL